MKRTAIPIILVLLTITACTMLSSSPEARAQGTWRCQHTDDGETDSYVLEVGDGDWSLNRSDRDEPRWSGTWSLEGGVLEVDNVEPDPENERFEFTWTGLIPETIDDGEPFVQDWARIDRDRHTANIVVDGDTFTSQLDQGDRVQCSKV